MFPTVFGGLVVLLAALLWRRGISGLLAVVAGVLVLGGSAAVLLPALGGTSVSPAHLAILPPLLWLVVRRDQAGIFQAVRANWWLIAFALFGAVSAFLLPRLFAGDIYVTPMRPTRLDYIRDPLGPTTQNLTQAVYLLGTALLAVLASYAAMYGDRRRLVFVAILVATAANLAFAVLDIAGQQAILDVFRNGAYAQLTQEFGKLGVKRVAGSFAEASQFATFSFGAMALCVELWLRHIWPRATGILAALTAVVLVLSTSTTAYLSFAVYVPLMIVRLLFLTSGTRRLSKGLTILAIGFTVVVAGLVLAAANPSFAQSLADLVESLTAGKFNTASGRERLMWAKQGLEAFTATWGLGIGIGSFRSSSMITAVIGSVGVIGILTLGGYLVALLAPWRPNVYKLDLPERAALGEAAAAASLFSLIPAFLSSPQADPGLLFALLAGFALGARLAPPEAADAVSHAAPSALELRRQRLHRRSA